jgi:hypothetical protein
LSTLNSLRTSKNDDDDDLDGGGDDKPDGWQDEVAHLENVAEHLRQPEATIKTDEIEESRFFAFRGYTSSCVFTSQLGL